MEAESGLPEISLDPQRMEQVLGNLISYALRYTGQGGGIRSAVGWCRSVGSIHPPDCARSVV